MKTRYILYPLLMLLAILLPTSCSTEEDFMDVPTSDSEKVQLNIDLTLAGTTNAESRGFGDNVTTFKHLHVALFEKISDGNYYLKGGILQATNNNGAWSVEIPTTGNECHLHFIANYEGLTGSFNEEGQLIGLLETNGANHDVYWNYVSLDGIGGNNQAELSLTVPLLRNYVQVKIDNTNSNFGSLSDVQYLLYNVPTKGTVAAYGTSVEGKFPHFEKFNNNGTYQKDDNGQYVLKSYTELTREGYAGNEPYDNGSLIGKNTSDYLNNNDNWISKDNPFYMYERSNKEASKKTCMLIRGIYNGASDYTYYKLDFVYNDASTQSKVYYNLLRNFIYTMKINEVNGEGYSTPEEALSQPACNNISGDAVAANYTNISNGKGQLLVSSTYMMFTNTNEAYLYFKYIPSVEEPDETGNTAENVTISFAPLQQGQSSPVSDYEVDWNGGEGQYAGWGKITFTPNTPGDIAVSQEMTISAGATYEGTGANKVMVDAGLQRTITLSLRKPFYADAQTSWVTATKQQVGDPQKTVVVITMSLPDLIPPSLFPLRMFISSAKNTLYATGIPIEVRNGEYGFIKEISLSDYNNRAKTPITQTLLPNCTDYGTTINVKNEYFATGSVTISH